MEAFNTKDIKLKVNYRYTLKFDQNEPITFDHIQKHDKSFVGLTKTAAMLYIFSFMF